MALVDVMRLSEPYSPTGGTNATFLVEATKVSSYSRGETLFRELVQNSWDARAGDAIKFQVLGRTLTRPQSEALSRFLLGASVNGPGSVSLETGASPLSGLLEKPRTDVLIVRDEGTIGLRGTLRPEEAGGSRNFVRYFFDVGRDADTASDGGAFGVGRTVAYGISEMATAVVFSQFDDGGPRARLMGMALGGSFDHVGSRYTGRHWWGRPSGPHILPVEDEDARAWAEAIGLLPDSDEPGTSIMIIAPREAVMDTEDNADDAPSLVEGMRDAAAVFAWPHVVDATIDFHFEQGGATMPPLNLADDPHLANFIRAYRALGDDGEKQRETIYFRRGGARPQDMGVLAWTADGARDARPLRDIPSSVALMRAPKFIVKYLPISRPAQGVYQSGVFKVSEEFEDVFRTAEPIAHDDWLPAKLNLPKGAHNPVAQALRYLAERLSVKIATGGAIDAGTVARGVAQGMQSLFQRGVGIGGTPPPKGKPSKGKKKSKPGVGMGFHECRLEAPPKLIGQTPLGAKWQLVYKSMSDTSKGSVFTLRWSMKLTVDDPNLTPLAAIEETHARVIRIAQKDVSSASGTVNVSKTALGNAFTVEVFVPNDYQVSVRVDSAVN